VEPSQTPTASSTSTTVAPTSDDTDVLAYTGTDDLAPVALVAMLLIAAGLTLRKRTRH
jgi:LPXTG-motif cell wall-anchored protein